MGCNCKNENGVEESKSGLVLNTHKVTNYIIKGFIFLIIIALVPLTIPILWWFTFKMLFMDTKSVDLVPSLKGIISKIGGKKFADNYNEDEVDEDFNPDDYELVTKIDEIN